MTQPLIDDPVKQGLRQLFSGECRFLREIRDINYGKKIVVSQGFLWAEVNVFYGRKGFSVVRSPKAGADEELGNQLEAIVWEVLNKPTEVDYGVHPDGNS